MSIVSENKEIAHFVMEAKCLPDGVHEAEGLKYHSSWDWLIPVVEKIESMGYKVKICRSRCQICKDDAEEFYLVDVKVKGKIKSVHSAVYHFINLIKSKK